MNEKLDITVLLVEDDDEIREILAIVLTELVRSVVTASNGRQGLELCETHHPDVLVTDVKMPGMSGLEMIRQVRYQNDGMKIVVMSAYEETSFFLEAIDIGVDGFLVKPIHIDRFTSLIEELGSVAMLERKLSEEEDERLRVELELHRSEAKYHSLFNSMRDGVVLFEIAENDSVERVYINDVNPAYADMLGTEHQADLPLLELARQAVQQGRSVVDERYIPLLGRHFRINLFQPQEGLFAAILTDLTERKRIEEEVQALNRNLEKRVEEELHRRQEQQRLLIQKSKLESLGILAAGIAHEINQPLTRISLGLGNIAFKSQSGKLNGSYVEQKCEDLLGDVERIKQIIDHIKTFSREQKSDLFERIAVNDVVQAALLLVQNQYRNHGIELVLEPAAVEQHTIGNPYRLEQVLLNLLSNAHDAVEERGEKEGESFVPRIVLRTGQSGKRVFIEVEDNGVGISPEDLEMIFEPFFTRKDTDRGTGLGLSISYGIIGEMRGAIEAASEPGAGTRMRVWLPVIDTTGGAL